LKLSLKQMLVIFLSVGRYFGAFEFELAFALALTE
jgi:hypothetical protein